jgi:hypothetical protein
MLPPLEQVERVERMERVVDHTETQGIEMTKMSFAPRLQSVCPSSAERGKLITVTGANLASTKSVTVSLLPSMFYILSDYKLVILVPQITSFPEQPGRATGVLIQVRSPFGISNNLCFWVLESTKD